MFCMALFDTEGTTATVCSDCGLRSAALSDAMMAFSNVESGKNVLYVKSVYSMLSVLAN